MSGGYYQVAWTRFSDREISRFSFNQYTAEVRQYFPVFDIYRVLALRAVASFADPLRGNDVPFFMMGKLGGPESLRGFSNSRFHDKNFLLLNAAYRWHVFTQMDAVVFADAGRVFPDPKDISLKKLDASYGLGVRLRTPYGPLFRLEYAFSNENSRLMFILRPAF